MAKESRLYYYQEQFTSGKLGRLLRARSDSPLYSQGCKELKNFRPTIQGPIKKRRGTVFDYEVKNSMNFTRLAKFIFNETDNFTLEFGDLYIRFIQGITQVTSGGSPYEIVSPYTSADLPSLKFAQIGDLVYITHPSYKPRKLTRIATDNWTLAEVDYKQGPCQNFNTSTTTITLSGTLTEGASSTWTASTATFLSTDVGTVWGIAKSTDTGIVGYAKMSAFTSTTVATFTNQDDLTPVTTVATLNWKKPAWSATLGWPRGVAFHEQRLFFGGNLNKPLTIWGSSSNGAYENFDIGTAADDDALIFELAGQINTIQWLKSDGLFLTAGTLGGLAYIGSSNVDAALTPTNVKTSVGTSYGASQVQGIVLNDRLVYVNSNGQTLYEAVYNDSTLKYTAIDLNDYYPEALSSGVSYLDTIEQPDLTAVCVTGGKLMLLSRDELQKILGWYEYEINGYVESIVTLPTITDDRIMLVVKRTINGLTKRYIEHIELEGYVYLDSSIQYGGAETRTITGLSHLEGQTVSVLGNYSNRGEYVVSSGSITIPSTKNPVTEAVIGLPYDADMQLMPINVALPQTGGTTQTFNSRINRLNLMLDQTRGLKIGADFDNLEVIPNRNVTTIMDSAPNEYGEIYPDIIDWDFAGDWTRSPTVAIRSDLPFDATINGLLINIEVEVD